MHAFQPTGATASHGSTGTSKPTQMPAGVLFSAALYLAVRTTDPDRPRVLLQADMPTLIFPYAMAERQHDPMYCYSCVSVALQGRAGHSRLACLRETSFSLAFLLILDGRSVGVVRLLFPADRSQGQGSGAAVQLCS